MSEEPIRLLEDPRELTPEAEFLRAVLRADDAELPSAEKMSALTARVGVATRAPASRLRLVGSTLALALVVSSGTWWFASSPNAERAERLERTSIPKPEHDWARLPPAAPPPASADLHVEPSAVRVESTDVLSALPAVSANALPPAKRDANPPAGSSAVRAARSTTTTTTTTTCADEVDLVDRADAALRAGEPERALAVTREHAARCAAGDLVQERERIAIEALAKLGEVDAMRLRARAFEERFPSSSHLRRIRRVVDRHRDP